MIAANRNRKFAGVHDALGYVGEPDTRVVDFGQVPQLLVKAGQRMTSLNRQVAAIVDFITQLRDALGGSGDANRSRAEVHAAFALAVTQRYAQNADRAARAR